MAAINVGTLFWLPWWICHSLKVHSYFTVTQSTPPQGNFVVVSQFSNWCKDFIAATHCNTNAGDLKMQWFQMQWSMNTP